MYDKNIITYNYICNINFKVMFMAWKYKKRLKVIPGVHLNFSKSGISTTIGVKGASINLGTKGTHINTGIPGTGIYNRTKISDFNISNQTNNISYPKVDDEFIPIISTDILSVTSENMEGIKELIESTRSQRQEIRNDIFSIKKEKFNNDLKKYLLYFIFPLAKNKIVQIKEDINSQKEVIIELKNQLENCYVNFKIDFEEDVQKKYDAFILAFKALMGVKKIWDITDFKYEDRIKTRSAAGTTIKRIQTHWGIKSLPEIKTSYDTLYMKNVNGGDLYFYPNFVIMYSNKKKYAIIDFADLQLNYSSVPFVETGTVPSDTKILYHTWAKVNKDGSRDKRFKNNYQIPVVAYGGIRITSSKGINEEYQCSNDELTKRFIEAYNSYKQIVKML